ncbi:ATP-binding protein [Thalassoglobus sp. JC818]|uniref:ATP-binding protein n=1 Tax=Thalassoglobus sp. JC818 TaxID=3232136 RepID=UPI00345AC00C
MHLELTFGNDRLHLPSVAAFANTSLQQLPLDEKAIVVFNEIVETAAENAIDQAYPAGTSGLVTLSILELHGKLEIVVRDFGMPRDVEALEEELQSAGQNARSRIAALAADVADEVHWIAYGRDGKALRIVKWLHDDHVTETSSPEKIEKFTDEPPAAPEQSYTFRRMWDDEAEQVSQLMYRTYGNTYFNEDVYYPARIAAENARGLVISFVAVDESGQIAGHYALERNQKGPVAEGGQAVVDPAHRGRGLLDQMKSVALDEAAKLNLVGWYADAVTVHTFTQKSNAAHGGQLTCVDLAISPKKEHFDSASDQPQRVTCLLFFHWLTAPAAREIFVPTRHQSIVSSIYKCLNCPLEFGQPVEPEGLGSLAIKVDSGAARANISVEAIGLDTAELIQRARRELVERDHVEVVYVELPLGNASTPQLVEELEQDGFGFLGIAPNFAEDGDLLRMAYLVEAVDRAAIHILEDVAGELVDYVLNEQKRVRADL